MRTTPLLTLAFMCLGLAGVAMAALGDDPKTLTTAPNNTDISKPGRNTLYKCPMTGTANGVTKEANLYLTLLEGLPFVNGTTVIIDKIPTVEGSVQLDHEFEMRLSDTQRNFRGNGIPNHPIGVFPIQNDTEAYKYYSPLPAEGYANAAEIPAAPYEMDVTVPRFPKVSKDPTCISDIMVGISTQTGAGWHVDFAIDNNYNSVDPNAALPTDLCWGHPYMTQYHYHGFSWKCMPNKGKDGEHSPLFGYALDGFGIYGPRSEGGKLVTNDELDECHGHVHEIDWDGELVAMYHYHLTTSYPYTLGCFRGTPVNIVDSATSQISEVRFAEDVATPSPAPDAGGSSTSPSPPTPAASGAKAVVMTAAAAVVGAAFGLMA